MHVHDRLSATCIVAALLSSASAAQIKPIQAVPKPTTWSRTYGGPVAGQGLFDLRLMPGGRLVAAGYTDSFGGAGQSNWLLDVAIGSGKLLHERACGSALGGFTDGAAIAADGGALFLGRDVIDLFSKHDAWLMRVDASGNVLWTQGFTRPGDGRHFLFDAAELADGSWIAVGATSIADHPPAPAWIVRLNASGVPLWNYEYGGGQAESARSVTRTSDGGFAVAGVTDSFGTGSDDAWVMKLDATGAIQWQRTFGGLDADQAEEIVEFEDGSLAVVGFTNSLTPSGHAPWILRVSSTGSLVWHQVVASSVWGDLGGAASTDDGNLLVIGRVFEPGSSSNDLWCAKVASADGGVLWQRAYEGDVGDFGSAILPLPSGIGLALGGTWGFGFAEESIWIQRTTRTGELLGCELERATTFSLISPSISVQSSAFARVPGGAQTQLVGVQVPASDADVIDRCD